MMMRYVPFSSLLLATLCGLLMRSASAVQAPVYLTAGTVQITDAESNVWQSDVPFVNGGSNLYPGNQLLNRAISGVTLGRDDLYKQERWDPTGVPEMQYSIPLESGTYNVELHFAEVYSGAMGVGKRVFRVNMEGALEFDTVDIYAAVGGNAAHVLSTQLDVTDGFLTVDFEHIVENPKINAISITPANAPVSPSPSANPSANSDPPPVDIYINSGRSSSYTDANLVVWEADRNFNSGRTYTRGFAVSGQDATIYQSERYDNSNDSVDLEYSIPVPNGEYTLTLHFAEIYFAGIGNRVFDVDVEGSTFLNGYDIVQHAGGRFIPITETTAVMVSDGLLDIALRVVTQNPKISGIEIHSVPGGPVNSPPTAYPTMSPAPSNVPTVSPTKSPAPSRGPSDPPTKSPAPSFTPTVMPTTDSPINTVQPAISTSSPSDIPQIPNVEILLNAGGPTFVDSDGNTWLADAVYLTQGGQQTYTTGSTVSGNTTIGQLYRSERWAQSTTYVIDNLPNGDYDVYLHFAEIYHNGAGLRVFDVKLQGVDILPGFDVWSAAGGKNRAHAEYMLVTITNGELEIKLDSIVDNAKISGIEIRSVGGGATPATPSPVVPTPAPVMPTPSPVAPSPAPAISSPVAPPTPAPVVPTTPAPVAPKTWTKLAEPPASTARHELSFVQAGDHFFLFGGRENPRTLDKYNVFTKVWTQAMGMPPSDFNHFQATEHEGLIWVIGAFMTNSFPTEMPAGTIYVYNPADDIWMMGPPVPTSRKRGSTGLVMYQGKFYICGGNTVGHTTAVDWMDEYDPETGQWTVLPDAPHKRDHFHTAVVGNKMYAAGGRRSSHPVSTFEFVEPAVDVFDFTTMQWDTTGLPDDLPNPRAAPGAALFMGQLLIMGGERHDNSRAFKDVHALDVATGTWSTELPMNKRRHGTQAIVSGMGLYIAAGSPNRGGGTIRGMEVYNLDQPAGTPSVSGTILTATSIDVPLNVPTLIAVDHDGGNQGVLVTKMLLSGTDVSDFTIVGGFPVPLLVPIGGSLAQQFVEFSGTVHGATAQLSIEFNGNETVVINLVGTLPTSAPTSNAPSRAPSSTPSKAPSSTPSKAPSKAPSGSPTSAPVTSQPSEPPGPLPMAPTTSPSAAPSKSPSVAPVSPVPSAAPSKSPSVAPVTAAPSPAPSESPSAPVTAAPVPAPVPSALTITDFFVVNATNSSFLVPLDMCDDCLSGLDASMVAIPFGTVGSVQITISGPITLTRTENVEPYSVFGDDGVDYNSMVFPPGAYTITAQAWSGNGLSGTSGDIRSEDFTISGTIT